MGCSPSTVTEGTDLSKLKKPQIFFVLGGPGSGKGTQCDKLVSDYRFKHISTGDLLREEKERGGPQAQELAALMKEGKLVSSSTVVRLMKKSIALNGCRRYLIDGFPRNQENLTTFNEIMKDSVEVKKLIFFNCGEETMTNRIMERAKTSGRVDDNPESIKKRLEVYQKDTIPIVQKFKQFQNCIEVNAQKSVEQVYEETTKKLSEGRIYPPNPANVYMAAGNEKASFCKGLGQKCHMKFIESKKLAKEIVNSQIAFSKEVKPYVEEDKEMPMKLYFQAIQTKMQRQNYCGHYMIIDFPITQEALKIWKQVFDQWTSIQYIFLLDHEENKKYQGIQTSVYQHFDRASKLEKLQKDQPLSQKVEKCLSLMNIETRTITGGKVICCDRQRTKIKSQFNFQFINCADLIKQQIEREGLYSGLLNQGQIPNQLLVRLIHAKLTATNDGKVVLLVGFPSSAAQLQKWLQIVTDFNIVQAIQEDNAALESQFEGRRINVLRGDEDTIINLLADFK